MPGRGARRTRTRRCIIAGMSKGPSGQWRRFETVIVCGDFDRWDVLQVAGPVGDSPLIGCGCYADATAGGVSCTGYGEAIMKIVMAKTATDRLRSGNGTFCVSDSSRNVSDALPHSCGADTAMHAAREAVHLLAKRTHATGGLILLDCEGNPGFAFNTPRMAYGYVAENGSLFTAV